MITIDKAFELFGLSTFFLNAYEDRWGWKMTYYDSDARSFRFMLVLFISGMTVTRFINLAEKDVCADDSYQRIPRRLDEMCVKMRKEYIDKGFGEVRD